MKKTKLAIAIAFVLASFTVVSAQATTYVPVNVTPAALQNVTFYAGILGQSVQDLASQILLAFSVPYKTVSWTPALVTSPSVSISIIRQTSSNPISYALVRVVSSSTPNTGSFSYVASSTDAGTYVQVGCVLTPNACQAFSLIPNP